VLLDVQMPVLDGLEAVAAIRKQEESTGAHQPVIAMTAHTMAGDQERCLDAGMDDYVSKPISAASLAAALERVLTRFPLTEVASLLDTDLPEAITSQIPKTKPVAFDREIALKKFDGDQDFLLEIAGMFLDGITEQMTSLSTALEHADVGTVGKIAHTVKGSVSHFGAERAFAAALRLEQDAGSGDVGSLTASHECFVREIEQLIDELRHELTITD
jgi:two-component system, sensor histidine kinase and response regulator